MISENQKRIADEVISDFIKDQVENLRAERDVALERAKKAEAWITTHENYLGEMETALCVHGNLHVPVTTIREWFGKLVWFDATTPEPTEEPVDV